MASNDLLRRLLDAGATFTDMTRSRAESIVQELVRTGELSVDQAQANIQELVDRSRQNTERLIGQVRSEIANQLGSFGLASKSEVEALTRRIEVLETASISRGTARVAAALDLSERTSTGAAAPAKKPTAKRSGTTKSAAKNSAAKKSVAKRPAGLATKPSATKSAKKSASKSAKSAQKTAKRAKKAASAPSTG